MNTLLDLLNGKDSIYNTIGLNVVINDYIFSYYKETNHCDIRNKKTGNSTVIGKNEMIRILNSYTREHKIEKILNKSM